MQVAHDMLMTDPHTILAASARELQFSKIGIHVYSHTLPSTYDILTIQEGSDSAVATVSWVEPTAPPNDEGKEGMYHSLYDGITLRGRYLASKSVCPIHSYTHGRKT